MSTALSAYNGDQRAVASQGLHGSETSFRFDPYRGHVFTVKALGVSPETVAAVLVREPVNIAFSHPGLLVGAVGLNFAFSPAEWFWATFNHGESHDNLPPIEGIGHAKGFPKTRLRFELVNVPVGQTIASRCLVLPASFAWSFNHRVRLMIDANQRIDWIKNQRAMIARHIASGSLARLAQWKAQAVDDDQGTE